MKPTWVDRAISWIAPEVGLRRLGARAALEMVNRYNGARRDKRGLKAFTPKTSDADGDILSDLSTLRDRARDLVQNAPLAKGAIDTKVVSIVGPGLLLHSQIDRDALGMSDETADAWEQKAEREFRAWAESFDCDVERTSNFYDLQALVLRSVFESGDVFALLAHKKRPGSPYGLKIQLIEADRVSNPRYQQDTLTCAGGVEKDAEGAPVGYWISNFHPGAKVPMTRREWVKKDAFIRVLPDLERRNVLHIYPKLRVGQTRGVPDLAPIIQHLKHLSDYTESELMAALVSSFFTVFVKSKTGGTLAPMVPEGTKGGDSDDYKMGPAAILRLMDGEDVQIADPNRPNANFDAFTTSIIRQCGVALGVPYELMVKHFTASYSAARAAFIEAWKTFSERRVWIARHFCQPVYEAFLLEAVLSGRLHAPGFLDDPTIRRAYCQAVWIGPPRGQIDELKEAKAARERIALGISTRELEAAEHGYDFETLHRQLAKEYRMRLEDGLDPLPEPGSDSALETTETGDERS